MRRLSLDQVETFLAVLAHGSFSAAARKVNLSQPAVSHQIRELETRLGVRLIDRVGKQAYPTEAGREFVPIAERLLAEADAAALTMRRHQDDYVGTVRVGTANNVVVWILPEIIRKLRADHPRLDVAISTDWTGPIVEGIVADRIDVALVTLPVPAGRPVDVEPWRDEDSYALFPADRAPPEGPVTPEAVINEPLILPKRPGAVRRLVDAWFETAGLTPKPIIELSNSEAIKAMVAAGIGATVLPGEHGEHHGHGRLVARPLDPPATRKLAIVTRRYRTLDRATRLFIEAAKAG